MKKWPVAVSCLLFYVGTLHSEFVSTEGDFASKVVSFLLVKDYEGAKNSCELAIKIFPESTRLKSLYIRTLSEGGECEKALEVFKRECLGNELGKNFDLLESLSWGILSQREKDSEMGILASLIGAYLTQDARAVQLIRDGMQSSNAYIRGVAIQLACYYNDSILQKEILRLLQEERNWFVRKEVIAAVGKMRLKEAAIDLKEMVASRAISHEEKQAAIQSLVMLHDDLSKEELVSLLQSKRAGFRELAVVLVDHFEKKPLIGLLLPLLSDSSPSVRTRMLAMLGSINFDVSVFSSIKEKLKELSRDLNPEVAIMSDWVLLKVDTEYAKEELVKWILSKNLNASRFAASVLGAGGTFTAPILESCFNQALDKYAKANLAYKMLEQGIQPQIAGTFLRSFLVDRSEKIMLSEGIYPCFTQILPSKVRHMPNVQRYPEMVDQLSRLKILNALAIAGISDLKEIAKSYLQGQVWGVVGSAAVFFIEEGEMASVDIVRELLDDEDQTVRVQAALALAFYGGEKRTAKVLEEAFWKVDWDKKISILEAVGHVGSRESIPFLLSVLEEPFTLPRTIAASSIIQCLYH